MPSKGQCPNMGRLRNHIHVHVTAEKRPAMIRRCSTSRPLFCVTPGAPDAKEHQDHTQARDGSFGDSLVARQCARTGKLHRARRHSHAGRRVECADCRTEEPDANASDRLGIHIPRRRAAGHHRCAEGCFRKTCRCGRRGRATWSETYDAAKQNAPATNSPVRLTIRNRPVCVTFASVRGRKQPNVCRPASSPW